MHLMNLVTTELLFLICVVIFLVLWWSGKLPSVDTFTKLVNTFDSRGGTILILVTLSIIGIFASLRMFYFLIDMFANGRLKAENPLINTAISFVTGGVAGAFIGALLIMLNSKGQPNQAEEKKGTE